MTRPRRRHSLLALALGASASACAAPEGLPLPALTWEGEHVVVGASVDLSETCEGTLAYADAYVGQLRERFGTDQQDRVELYWLPDGVELYEGCIDLERDVFGCSIGARAMAEDFPTEHEYVHAAWNRDSAPALEEGLATYLGDDATRDWGPWYARPMADAFEKADELGYLPPEYYGSATSYVAHLVDRFGAESVFDLIGGTGYGDSSAEIDAQMQQVVGVSLQDTLTTQRLENAECDPYLARDTTVSCALAPPVPFTCEEPDAEGNIGRGLRVQAFFRCGDDGVIGPKLGWVWESYVFDVPVEGEYEFLASAIGPSGLAPDFYDIGSILLEECAAGCNRLMAPLDMSTGSSTVFPLQPARYRVRLARRVDVPSQIDGIEVEIRAAPTEAFAALCAANHAP